MHKPHKPDLNNIVVNGSTIAYNPSKGNWIHKDTNKAYKPHNSYIQAHLDELIEESLNKDDVKEDITDIEIKTIRNSQEHGQIIKEKYQK